jgi:phosphoenolpyruvate synthase/pyruvate phosphate dikinase
MTKPQEINPVKSGYILQKISSEGIIQKVIVAAFGLRVATDEPDAGQDCYIIENDEIKESKITNKNSVLTQSEIEKLLTATIDFAFNSKDKLLLEFTFQNGELHLNKSSPKDISLPMTPIKNNQLELRGIPSASGVALGECEIILSLDQAPSASGKILVTDRAETVWECLFNGIIGLIIEKGSILSHAAIVSRELGIPCIISVKDATRLLTPGMKIRMNGDTGEILVVQS